MEYDLHWFVNAFFIRLAGTLGMVPLAALAALLVYWLRKRFFPPKTDQMSFLYAYFDDVGCRDGQKRLNLSTQHHLANCAGTFSRYDLKLLGDYGKKAAAGTVLRLASRHSQALVGNVANLFWAKTCGDGQLAKSQGLPTKEWTVMVALIASPKSGGVTRKHRVLVASIDDLQRLPTLSQVLPTVGMTVPKLEEWMTALANMAIVLREEGSENPHSARVNQMVIRC